MEADGFAQIAPPGRPVPGPLGGAVTQVLQYLPLPVTLDSRRYRDALSSSNPKGDLLPLRAFRDLVDPLPTFTTYYGGQGSTEMVYSMIVHSATAPAQASFARGVIADSRQRLAQQAYSGLDQLPGTWCPVFASPGDWAEETPESRFADLSVDLEDAGTGTSPFAFIGRAPRIAFQTAQGQVPVHPDTTITAVRMKYLLVTLQRPWLNTTLFATNGWRLPDQPSGFCSSGRLDDNDGVMPLLPTALLLARDVEVEADWARSDQQLLDRGEYRGISLGPLPLGEHADSTLHVIAWVSALVPRAPGLDATSQA